MTDHGLKPVVAVIGGGVSGLAAAHRLVTSPNRQGRPPVSVTLIEKSPHLGGKVVTEHSGGFLIEGGPDSFVAGKGFVLELTKELGLSDRVISSRPEARGAQVWSRGRLHPIPEGLFLMAPSRLSPVLRSSLLSWKGKLRVLGDLIAPRGRHDGDESLEEFVVRRLGREMLDRIAEPLIAGIHSGEPSTMSLAASFPRFVDMEREHRSLILAARSTASKPTANPAVGNGLSYFASFKDGMAELPGALIKALNGIDIKTGRALIGLVGEGTGRGYRLTLDDRSEIRAQGVILATPAQETAGLLSEMVPQAASIVSDIHQVATATVTLAYRVDDIPGLIGSGFVVPSVEQRRIMGVSYLSRKWHGRVPHQKVELLRAFIGGPRGQELAMSGEERLVAVVREELADILAVSRPPVLARTHTWAGGLHQYTLGHVDRVIRIESALSTRPGLAVAGAAFHGIGLNECVQSGRTAADAVLDALVDPRLPGAAVVLDSGGRD